MELDDFRRGWKQPTAAEAPAALDTAALAKLLASHSNNPVAKMRRNVWLEIGFAVGCVLVSCVALVYARSLYAQAMLGWLIVLCLLSSFYYRRKLVVLRCLSDASGPLRDHVARQLSSLRGLVQLYFQATMWSLPVSLGIGLVLTSGRILHTFSGLKPLLLGLGGLVVGYGLIGWPAYLGMRWFTRWYLQRLYGQHLDRLEGLLRELEE